ncbi:MAG TPA: YceI family protein [Thermoanaerobaculia bacterium]|nr:YceI family protein [Thermoanaerobaculia bacterium]
MTRPRLTVFVVFAALTALGPLVVVSASPAAGESLTFTLEPQATQVTFELDATLHTVHGSLKAAQGTLTVDPATGAASGEVILDLTSAATGNSGRDKKMHAEILETARYPKAVFHVARVDGALKREGASSLQLRGALDFHGATHAISLPAIVTVHGNRATATGNLTIPFVAWGLKDPSFGFVRVGKDVKVEIRAAGRLAG